MTTSGARVQELVEACRGFGDAHRFFNAEGGGTHLGPLVSAQQRLVVASHDLVGDTGARAEAIDWLGEPRVDSLVQACARQPLDECVAAFHALSPVIDSSTADEQEQERHLRTWMDSIDDVFVIALEAGNHVDAKMQEERTERAIAAARETPGMSLHVTETGPNNEVLRDEVVFGPEPGHEDLMGLERPAADVKKVLGLDSNALVAAWQSLAQEQIPEVVRLLRLPESADDKGVRLTLAKRMLERATSDSGIAQALGSDLHGSEKLRPGDWASLRSQVLLMWSRPLSDGAYSSRADQGDLEAFGALNHMIVLSAGLLRAAPFFVPHDMLAMQAPTAACALNSVLPAPVVAVFHDQPVPLAGDLEAIGWLFVGRAEDEYPHPVGAALCRDGTQIVHHLVSPTEGDAAPVMRRVLGAIQTGNWGPRKRLRLPGSPGSKEWLSKLGRSRNREISTGSLTRVRHHLP